MAAEQFVVLQGAEEKALLKLADYREAGGFAVAREGPPDGARGGGAGDPRLRPARPWRRLLPDRPQGELPREGHGQADLPRRQRGRVGAGHVQGPRDHVPRPAPADRGLPDHRACDRVRARLHLHPRRIPARVRAPAQRAEGSAQGEAARRRHDRPPPRCGRLHLRRGDCAAGVARGQARPAPDQAALPGHRRSLRLAQPDQQRGDDCDRAEDHRAGREGVRQDRCPARLVRHARLLPLRQCRQRRQLRAADGRDAARADLRRRRRHSGRA